MFIIGRVQNSHRLFTYQINSKTSLTISDKNIICTDVNPLSPLRRTNMQDTTFKLSKHKYDNSLISIKESKTIEHSREQCGEGGI